MFYYITEIQSEEFEFQSLVADSQPATLPYANLSIVRSFTVVEDETCIYILAPVCKSSKRFTLKKRVSERTVASPENNTHTFYRISDRVKRERVTSPVCRIISFFNSSRQLPPRETQPFPLRKQSNRNISWGGKKRKRTVEKMAISYFKISSPNSTRTHNVDCKMTAGWGTKQCRVHITLSSNRIYYSLC